MNYEDKYVENLYRKFNVPYEAKLLFEDIIKTPTEKRQEILKGINTLAANVNLSYALLALYRQQVNSGFVLGDPLRPEGKEEKTFFDPATNITFHLQWNPDRELRKSHELLIERGVIAKNVDGDKLINKNKDGKACYLCKKILKDRIPVRFFLKSILQVKNST